MARKTTGSSTTTRSKKTVALTSPATQVAPEVGQEAPTNGKSAVLNAGNLVTGKQVPSNFNLDEEIRHRAYELYLQRATSGNVNGNGDENQDWLTAENEIRARYGTLARHTTA
ncbi:MAG: DUF2934 domain-containing protein [Terriglobales bacterium]